MFISQNWPKTANSSWHCSFNSSFNHSFIHLFIISFAPSSLPPFFCSISHLSIYKFDPSFLRVTIPLKIWFLNHFFFPGSYGDKTPKSFLGRVYASLWMFTGLLLMTSLTAQITSIITADSLRPLDEEFGYTVCMNLSLILTWCFEFVRPN